MEYKVVCAVPGSSWHPMCGLSVVGMTAYFAMNRLPGASLQTLSFQSVRGSMLPQLRYEAVQKALSAEATHLLFIDSDQSFPPDCFHRLVRHRKPVVACNVATKTFPSSPTARAYSPNDPKGTMIYTYPFDRGLRKVWRIGMGIMLVDMKIFKFIEKPWFGMRWEGNEYLVGEDWWFCERVQGAKFDIFIDQSLSNEVRHWSGETGFGHEMCLAELIMREDELRSNSGGDEEDAVKGSEV